MKSELDELIGNGGFLSDPEADYQMGMNIISGIEADKDLPEAVTLFRGAALQGHMGAQYELGVSYCAGRGIKQNSETALQWFFCSAKNGYPKALHNLGVRHSIGKGVNKDAIQAAGFFLPAAAQGHALAQFKLAVMYKLGWGVRQADEEADKWFGLAGDTGMNEGRCSLSELVNQENDRARWFKEAIIQGYIGNEFNIEAN
ncbi:tetratricopeptide repeat protein [Desulfosporosinus fructosivorans]|nr:tetratricopeptide repeat protein [Desulfosporosinus fructosivorans]